MTRSLFALLAALFFFPSLALAQTATPARSHAHSQRLDPELALSVGDAHHDTLSAIDDESHAATALYVTAVVLHVGGLGLAVGGAIAGFCIDFGSGCSGPHEAALPWEVSGLVIAGVGLLTFIPAILLDVDSGHRRDRLHGGHVAFSIGAGGVGVEGTF